MEKRRGDRAVERAQTPEDEPASPPIPRLQLYQKAQCSSYKDEVACRLDGVPVQTINADLTGRVIDLTKALKQPENLGVAARGIERGGEFQVDGPTGRQLLLSPKNVNLRPNSDVVRKFLTVTDLTARPSDLWLIDFFKLTEAQASFYEAPLP